MSDPRRVLLAGATGLVGTCVMHAVRVHPSLRLIALTRREAPIPRGTPMEMMVAEPARWPEAIATIAPDAVICALGTTRRKARSEEAFRAVDHDLVLALASAARKAEVANFVLVSSAGADPLAKAFYLRVKGETEAAVTKLRFRRFDILRPGLLRGARANDRRPLERLAMIASPLTDLLLFGDKRRYRSIDARAVAAAALQLSREKAAGRFVHDTDSILRAARRLEP
ncbi:MAG TPA: NAD-dependent epimerase/dehydratase family protein [Croceibacterium sp.]|nr:NAD-dependent epimerase/dehydratase family protein [Croceibacterium sp.]